KKLIELIESSGVAEIEITEGEESVRISRQAAAPPPGYAFPAAMVQAPTSPAAPAPAPAAAPEAPTKPATPAGEVVKSPMVGTFYRASNPGASPFIEVGQSVAE